VARSTRIFEAAFAVEELDVGPSTPWIESGFGCHVFGAEKSPTKG